jgi:hypothetical protein
MLPRLYDPMNGVDSLRLSAPNTTLTPPSPPQDTTQDAKMAGQMSFALVLYRIEYR